MAVTLRTGGRALAATLAGLLAVTSATAASASASPSAGLKQVTYLGYRFEVPRTWPVVNLSADPRACVRFDKHAIYLGTPGASEDCGTAGVARNVGALLVQPAAAATATSSVQDPVSQTIIVSRPGIKVTAVYGTVAQERQIRAIIASAALPAPAVRMPRPAAAAPAAAGTAAGPARAAKLSAEAAAAAAAGPGAGNLSGDGFDTCETPSSGAMHAWLASPYRAVGFYFGGEDRGCPVQPNLTSGWISQQVAAGWSFVPIYVGPQADEGQLSSPASQGTASAEDAVSGAEGLGLGLGTPLYYDMEAGFGSGSDGAVLSFLSAWTNELHALGYESGVYSSGSAAVTVLVDNYSRASMPDVIWDADYNGQNTTSDPAYIPAADWASDQRLHQYNGNATQTYGGVTIEVDQDSMNVRLPYGGSRQASQAVGQQNGTVDTFFEGSNGSLEHTFTAGNGWSAPANMNAGTIGSEPSVVTSAPGDVDVFWKGTDDNLWYEFYTPQHGWSGATQIRGMGPLGGAPYAVAQQNGTIDVFWRGTGTSPHLYHAWLNPGAAWAGPQNLGGSMASDPSPVESSPGTVDVFFEGTDKALWHAFYQPTSGWHTAASLKMGPLGGPPHAAGQLDGTIDVFWQNTSSGLEHAWYNVGATWAGPQDLGGTGEVASAPFAVTSSPGTVDVYFIGANGQLYWAYYTPSGGWHAPASLKMGTLGGAPFASAEVSGTTDVFWKGNTGSPPSLWHAWLNPGHAWAGPQNLGGAVK